MVKPDDRWITDADDVDLSQIVLYANPTIKRFLNSSKCFYVIGSKGMGKTLLLRHKRAIIETDNEKEDRGIILLPKHTTDMDHMRSTVTLDKDKIQYLKNKEIWKDLWEVSIGLSAILNFPILRERRDKIAAKITEMDKIPKQIREQFHQLNIDPQIDKLTPCQIIEYLLPTSKHNIEKIIQYYRIDINNIVAQEVKSAIYFFIDRIDQGIDQYEYDIWFAGQIGLIEASYELHRNNHHIKIYCAIRQEAYAAYQSIHKAAMHSYVINLTYTKDELEKMFKRALKYYEKIDSYKQYFGNEKIWNAHIKKKEKIFDYLYRHLIPIPRYLMILGNIFADRKHRNNVEVIREIVNTEMAKAAKELYLFEMKRFLPIYETQEDIDNLFRLIPRNILNYKDLIKICKRISEKRKCSKDCNSCNGKKPFSQLYNIGLIGIISHNPVNKGNIQEFTKPLDFNPTLEGNIPTSDYYIIHPSLNEAIREVNKNYKTSNKILIGDQVEWTRWNTNNAQRFINEIGNNDSSEHRH